MLEYLTTKTSLFSLEHFYSIYNNINQENQVQGSRRKTYKLATLDKNVELKCLPAGYHTSSPPDPEGPNILTSGDVGEGGEEVEVEDSNNANIETGLNIYLDRELDLVKYW